MTNAPVIKGLFLASAVDLVRTTHGDETARALASEAELHVVRHAVDAQWLPTADCAFDLVVRARDP